jgi:GNAT acetyltransferase 2
MGYGSRAVELLAKYYQGEIVSLDENGKQPEEDEDEEEKEGQESVCHSTPIFLFYFIFLF